MVFSVVFGCTSLKIALHQKRIPYLVQSCLFYLSVSLTQNRSLLAGKKNSFVLGLFRGLRGAEEAEDV